MADLVSNLRDEGLLPQRFVIVVPEHRERGIEGDGDIAPDHDALAAYEAMVLSLASLAPPVARSGHLDRAVITEAGQAARREVARFVNCIASSDLFPPHLRNCAPSLGRITSLLGPFRRNQASSAGPIAVNGGGLPRNFTGLRLDHGASVALRAFPAAQ